MLLMKQAKARPKAVTVQKKPVSVIGERVRLMRERRGWTQFDLSVRWGLPSTRVSALEHNRQNLTAPGLVALAVALAAEIDHPSDVLGYLVGLLDSPKR
jgi:transcriptional regulator with XRE-family HTH domain